MHGHRNWMNTEGKMCILRRLSKIFKEDFLRKLTIKSKKIDRSGIGKHKRYSITNN
jgi:hypothetical protein